MRYLLLSLLLLPLSAAADFAGVSVGLGFWNQSPSGDVAYKADSIDVEDDLSSEGSNEVMAWVRVEHPIPMIPNFKVRYSPMELSGSGNLSDPITFGNTTFTGSVRTGGDLDSVDLTAYYQVIDLLVDLDVGLNLKIIQGDILLEGPSGSEARDLEGAIPMLYARAAAELPLTGLTANLEGSGLSFGGDGVFDYELSLGYELGIGMGAEMAIGAELGYRAVQLDLDDLGDFEADVDFDGFFGLIYARVSVF